MCFCDIFVTARILCPNLGVVMIELFNPQHERQAPALQPSGWKYLNQANQFNLTKTVNYYRANPTMVGSQHLLIRLLQSLAVSWLTELELFYSRVDAKALTHAGVHGLTSAVRKGKIFYGTFYGGATPEIIVAVNEPVNPRAVTANWMAYDSVRVLTHVKTDTQLLLPNGQYSSEELGFAVILVHVPMLALQYRAFYRSQRTEGTPELMSYNQFIAGFILPKMLASHQEQVFFNHRYALAKREAPRVPNLVRRHPFSLLNLYDRMEDVSQELMQKQAKLPQGYENLLRATPSFTHDNALQSLQNPDVLPTYQVNWATTLARLRHLHCLYLQAGNKDAGHNQFWLNSFAKTLTRHNLQDLWFNYLPPAAWIEVRQILQEMGYPS